MRFFKKLNLLFFYPNFFLRKVRKEDKISTPFVFYVINYIFVAIVGFLAFLPFLVRSMSHIHSFHMPQFTLSATGVAMPFIAAGIIHLGVMMLKGAKGYFYTFKPVAYSAVIGLGYQFIGSIMFFILYLIYPFTIEQLLKADNNAITNLIVCVSVPVVIGFTGFFHKLYVTIKGVAFYQKLSLRRSFVACFVLPMLFLLALAVVFIIPFAIIIGAIFVTQL